MVSPPVLRIGDVADEAILLAGGARAILLQLANPAVGRGVAEHSDFSNRPLDRLRGTLTYLYVIVYGTPEESAIVARRVGAGHAPVRGDDYDARDQSLQLWVAATLYETAMRVHELVFGPLGDADAESLLADYAIVGTALGVPTALWPGDRSTFTDYWTHSEANLRVDAPARRVAHELLFPRRGPWWLKLSMPTIRVVTAGLLSDDLRAAYDLPLNSARYARLVRVVRAIYPRLPRAIRQWPQRHYLRKFRQGLTG
jgi:uncharacterized protein (DUF2236 family)